MGFSYTLKAGIPVVEVDNNIRETELSARAVEEILGLIQQAKQ